LNARPLVAVRPPARVRGTSVYRVWRESRLFRFLVVWSFCAGALGPMLYFQFSYAVDLSTRGVDGEQRFWIGVVVLATQFIVTTRLFRRVGIPLSIALSPLIYLIGFCGMSIRLNLAAGVGALAGTKLQDNAVYDPAMRILFNLFPERERSRATGLLEGPVKRAGGALGNILSLVAVQFASAIAVGYVAIPIALAWFAHFAVAVAALSGVAAARLDTARALRRRSGYFGDDRSEYGAGSVDASRGQQSGTRDRVGFRSAARARR